MSRESMSNPEGFIEEKSVKKAKWQWPTIEGDITPEKKKKFWEQLFALRPQIRSLVDFQLRREIPTAEVDFVTDKVIHEVVDSMDRFDSTANLNTWIRTVIKYAVIDAIRHYKRDFLMKGMPKYMEKGVADFDGNLSQPEQYVPDVIHSLPDESVDLEDSFLRKQRKNILYQAISQLPDPDDRTLISMFYFKHLSLKQICNELDMSFSNVASKLHRGRQKLLAILNDHKSDLV